MSTPNLALLATGTNIVRANPENHRVTPARGLERIHPGPLAWDPWTRHRAWTGTRRRGVFRSLDEGLSWTPSGLEGHRITALTASPTKRDLIWAGTEPSRVWRSDDGGGEWEEVGQLNELSSFPEWSFPPRPDTHHVRWIACHPRKPETLFVAIEAGALLRSFDGGRTWHDRVEDGPRDTHELAIHPSLPETLRVAAGDGFFHSGDGGRSWTSPEEGLEVRYLRSVAVDPGNPEIVLVSAATRPRSAYSSGLSDGRVYRREGHGQWVRMTRGWPEPPDVIAPLLRAGEDPGEFWAADERGIHRSGDGGVSWEMVLALADTPRHLTGFSLRPRSSRADGELERTENRPFHPHPGTPCV